ncbi:MAG: 7-cyano-7-deazaguanine synthase [Vicinamibacterales bacterium]
MAGRRDDPGGALARGADRVDRLCDHAVAAASGRPCPPLARSPVERQWTSCQRPSSSSAEASTRTLPPPWPDATASTSTPSACATGTPREFDAARRIAAALGAICHLEVDVTLSRMGGSALTDDIAVPKDAPLDPSVIPVTYVPARNTVFLSLALGWAEVVGATDLVIGVNALDYSGYPDCRPEFIRAFETLAGLATKAGVEGRAFRVQAPLIALSKAAIIRLGVSLARLRSHPQAATIRRPMAGRAAAATVMPTARRRLHRGRRRRSTGRDHTDMTDRSTTPGRRLHRLRRRGHGLHAGGRPVRRDAVGHRLLSDVGRTAARPRTPGGRAVVDVVEHDDGRLLHLVDGPLDVGARVHGAIDWTRRFGSPCSTRQHAVGGLRRRVRRPHRELPLGTTSATIDLGRAGLTPGDRRGGG